LKGEPLPPGGTFVTTPYRIILADDHVMFRQGVRSIIQGANDLEVVGEAGDGFELLDLLKKTLPHMVILDISMPNLRGLEATRELKNVNPGVKVLILTMHKDREYLYHAFSAGAEGYLLKEDADTELFNAIDTLRQGGTYVSPLLSPQLKDLFMEKYRYSGEKAQVSGETLTFREREVLKLIAEGKSSREIAELLFISSRTVQHHRANIMRKLNIKRTADLVRYAIQKGYTSPTDA
jgi:DNA-binding NarL/FixJ family response regulator